MNPQPAGVPEPAATLGEKITALPGNVRGAMWITVAGLMFVCVAVLIRIVGQRIPVMEILLIRQATMFVFTAPALIRHFPASMTTHRFRFHMARAGLALITMWLGFTALLHLPLADATALGFAKSFFLTIFAIIFLKETVGIRRWAAVIVGFVGVLVMLEPTSGVISVYALMAVGGAGTAALVMVIIRFLSRRELPITLLFYQTILVGLMALPFALTVWVTPTLHEMVILAGIGGLSAVGQICNIRAFRAGEAAFLAALDYTRLLWATLLGLILFAEWPTHATLAGAAIVIAAAIYTVRREARKGKDVTRGPGGRGYMNT